MKKRRSSSYFILLGVLMILAAGILSRYNYLENANADKWQQQVLETISETSIDETTIDMTTIVTVTETPDPEIQMPVQLVEGEYCIGILSIPDLDLTTPIIEEWSYERLKKAPCRYNGSVYEGNMIIAGHNYADGFRKLKSAQVGTCAEFTDMEGNVFHYKVMEVEVLEATSIEEMENSKADLTLFTCTYGGGARFTLRLQRIDQNG